MATLEYDISVVGLKNIDAAFAHVEKRAREANRRMMLGAQAATARGGVGGTRQAYAARAAKSSAMSAAQVEEAVAKRSAALKEKLAARTAARIVKIEADAARASATQRAALERKAALQRERSAARMARIEAASKSRQEAQSLRAKVRLESDAARRIADTAYRERAQKLSETRRSNARAAMDRTEFQGAVGRAAIGSVTSVGRAAVGTAMLGGTALIGSAIYTQGQEAFKAQQLANQAGTPTKAGEILKEAQGIQGFSGGEALAGLEQWTNITGDLEAGRGILAELGQTALATGTSLDDLAAASANAFIPLKDAIPDAKARMEALRNTIRATAGMGAVGAVEIKDLASEMAGLAAQAGKFAGGPEAVMRQSVAMAQAARQRGGADSAAEAVTSVARFGSDVMTKQKELRRMGVEVFTDKGHTKLRSQKDIMVDVLEKTHGDLGKIGELFGERSIRAVQGFSPLYNQAEAAKKGSGKAAVLAEFDRLEKSTLSDKDVNERAEALMKSPSMQFKETMKDLNAQLGTEFIPIVGEMVKALKDATPQIVAIGKAAAGIAGWAVKNPYEGVGALIAAKVSAEVASAAIGASVSKAREQALGGSAGLKLGAISIGAAIA
ncbi:MAG: hypothetical protein PHS14_19030, partial [Elusimicrobia bacterium]|nr:hypothetical protein [Elusimicrobiota bacterium]